MGKALIRYFPTRASGSSGGDGRRKDGVPDAKQDDNEDDGGAKQKEVILS